MDSDDTQTCQDIVGKTVERVNTGEGWIEIYFTDGSKLELSSQGNYERNWLRVGS